MHNKSGEDHVVLLDFWCYINTAVSLIELFVFKLLLGTKRTQWKPRQFL